jgi:hypothetical protein
MKQFAIAVALAVLLAAPSTGLAVVIHEEIGNQNDLPIDPPYPVLALSLGTNSVIGRTSFSGDAVDSFAVSVPAGLQLASITYVFHHLKLPIPNRPGRRSRARRSPPRRAGARVARQARAAHEADGRAGVRVAPAV